VKRRRAGITSLRGENGKLLVLRKEASEAHWALSILLSRVWFRTRRHAGCDPL
jgi:hypothetical protein